MTGKTAWALARLWIVVLFVLATTALTSCATAPAHQGVMVLKVDPSSPHKSKFAPGDRVLEVSQQAVFSKADIDKLVEVARLNGRKSILLLVNNSFGLRFLAVEITTGLSGVTFAETLRKKTVTGVPTIEGDRSEEKYIPWREKRKTKGK